MTRADTKELPVAGKLEPAPDPPAGASEKIAALEKKNALLEKAVAELEAFGCLQHVRLVEAELRIAKLCEKAGLDPPPALDPATPWITVKLAMHETGYSETWIRKSKKIRRDHMGGRLLIDRRSLPVRKKGSPALPKPG